MKAMSHYTIQLRWLIEGDYDLGMKDYPIFDETYRETLNNKIIQHYYFREIGFETEALFKNRLNNKLNEIMPYYNQLYKSAQIQLEPLSNVNYLEEISRNLDSNTLGEANTTGSGKGSTTTSGTSKIDYGKISKFSDIAQAQTSQNQILNDTYLTNATVEDGTDTTTDSGTGSSESTNTTKGTSKGTRADNEKTELRRKGNNGGVSESELLNLYRETFLNIDMMVIEDLSDLFLGIW
jgi:hypothetical protein